MNVESIKRRLLVKYPFFGSVVANSNFVAEEAIGTAGTDGKNIYYNPNFIESITNDQQTFIFAHEICHIAFNHIIRSEGKDKDLWNIATDSVINAFLKQDGLPVIEGVVDIPEAINFDAEEMYKKLLGEKKQHQNGQTNNQKSNQQQSQNQSNGEPKKDSNEKEKQQDVGHDTHYMWNRAVENKHQKGQQSQTDLGQSGDNDGDKQNLLDKLSKVFDKKKGNKKSNNILMKIKIKNKKIKKMKKYKK